MEKSEVNKLENPQLFPIRSERKFKGIDVLTKLDYFLMGSQRVQSALQVLC